MSVVNLIVSALRHVRDDLTAKIASVVNDLEALKAAVAGHADVVSTMPDSAARMDALEARLAQVEARFAGMDDPDAVTGALAN